MCITLILAINAPQWFMLCSTLVHAVYPLNTSASMIFPAIVCDLIICRPSQYLMHKISALLTLFKAQGFNIIGKFDVVVGFTGRLLK